MRTFVTGDAHGNHGVLVKLLQKAGVIDSLVLRINRNSIKSIQIGDLMNCIKSSYEDDLFCADNAKEWFDTLIVGNHEAPYLDSGAFNGFHHHPDLDSICEQWKAEGFYQPAIVIGDTLVSHAGVHERYVSDDLNTTYEVIQQAWHDNRRIDIISACGYARHGRDMYGGILWADWVQEPISCRFNQVVGHTPGDDVRTRHCPNGNWQMCIDAGAKLGQRIAGIMLDDAGQVLEVIKADGS